MCARLFVTKLAASRSCLVEKSIEQQTSSYIFKTRIRSKVSGIVLAFETELSNYDTILSNK